ncbi:DsbA family protein [Solicola sp. PLA-1-18]|uniref:DsbA family protein n=1 Tax=Solicola sp. PLA-1-18 TaxID=3380532 RepID=UPI003B7844B6
MKTQNKITAVVIAVVVAVLAAYVVIQRVGREEPASAAEAADILVREDSHRLGTPAEDGKATLVEFLDFECESCLAAYPLVEEMRKKYDGQVTFVMRYFPIPSHANAQNAAYAVEAASKQGQLEPMYKRMYETQTQWGEQQDSKAALFRSFAEDLGLDMAQYDTDVKSKATQERVAKDYEDGIKLGVQGTPTFFLNGKKLQPETVDDFTSAIDAAVTG